MIPFSPEFLTALTTECVSLWWRLTPALVQDLILDGIAAADDTERYE